MRPRVPPAAAPTSSTPRRKRKRRPLPEHLPRETHTHMPAEEACSACGGQLCKLGEDVSEMLEYIPASFKVIRHVRPKMCCTRCDAIVQAPAPSRPIDRGLAGPGLLAHVMVSKNNGSVMYCSWFHLRIAYSSEWAVMDVYKNGKKIDTMYPERRFYKASERPRPSWPIARARTQTCTWCTQGKNPDTGKPIIKAHVNPLVMWIWIGVVVVGFGTVITLIPNWKPPKVRAAEKERETRKQQRDGARWKWGGLKRVTTRGNGRKVRDLIKQIEHDGWIQVAQRGSHRQFKHPSKPGKVTIAGAPSTMCIPKTLSSILRQAGLKK